MKIADFPQLAFHYSIGTQVGPRTWRLRFWTEGEKLVANSRKHGRAVHVNVNVKHLRLHENREIEWVGEESCPEEANSVASGKKLRFDCIVLAVGFGLEQDTAFSYWRNETLEGSRNST